MIASVEGEVIGIGDHFIVIRVGGVGLQVYAPGPLRARLRMMEHIFLHTRLIVREDLLALYGFETEQEREYFDLLLKVEGVGPRLAMSVLSTLSVDAIRRAVGSERQGLSEEHLALCDAVVRIPMLGKSDSLNLAVATAVVLYEILNQRREKE